MYIQFLSHIQTSAFRSDGAPTPQSSPVYVAQSTLNIERGGRVLLTEILLPRIARLASNCSTGNCLSSVNKQLLSKSLNL